MSGKNIDFDDKKISKSNFYKNRKPFNIDEIDVDEILISKWWSYGKKGSFKSFIGYNDNSVIKLLCIKLPQMIVFVKHLDSNNTISFKARGSKR